MQFCKNLGIFKGSLHCAPLIAKDNMFSLGNNCTNGVRAFSGMRPGIDAPVVARLKDQGAVTLGKANMATAALSGSISRSEIGTMMDGSSDDDGDNRDDDNDGDIYYHNDGDDDDDHNDGDDNDAE